MSLTSGNWLQAAQQNRRRALQRLRAFEATRREAEDHYRRANWLRRKQMAAAVIRSRPPMVPLLAEQVLALEVVRDESCALVEQARLGAARDIALRCPKGHPLVVLFFDLLTFGPDPDVVLVDLEMLERVQRRAKVDLLTPK